MFSRILMFSVAVTFSLLFGCNTSSSDNGKKVVFKSQMDSVSFAIGYDIGRSLKIDSMNFNQDLIAAGMKAALAGDTTAMSQEDFKNVMLGFQKMYREKQMKAVQAAEGKKGAENKKFLDENGKKEGVKTTASGLQYKVIKEGNGKQPKGEDVVRVNYKGSLLNGKVFDASKEPIEFPVNGVIKGWTEALQLMKEGSKWMLFIPSELAYGAQGAGQAIGPNELLIFEVELLEVKSK